MPHLHESEITKIKQDDNAHSRIYPISMVLPSQSKPPSKCSSTSGFSASIIHDYGAEVDNILLAGWYSFEASASSTSPLESASLLNTRPEVPSPTSPDNALEATTPATPASVPFAGPTSKDLLTARLEAFILLGQTNLQRQLLRRLCRSSRRLLRTSLFLLPKTNFNTCTMRL